MPEPLGVWNHYNSKDCRYPAGWFGYLLVVGPENLVCTGVVETRRTVENGWLVSEGAIRGIAFFERGQWTFKRNQDLGLPDYPIHHLGADADGNLWLSVLQPVPALYCFDGIRTKQMMAGVKGLPDDIGIVEACTLDHTGGYWVSLPFAGGVLRYAHGTWQRIGDLCSGVSDNDVTALAVDSQGNVWCAARTGDHIVFCSYDGIDWQEHVRVPGTKYDVQALAVDLRGRLWVGWEQRGLWCFDALDRHWTKYTERNSSLPDHSVGSLVVDQQGRIWAGASGGLTIFTDTGSTLWNVMQPGILGRPRAADLSEIQADGDAAGYIALGSEVTCDSAGHVWANSGWGVSVFTELRPA